MSYTVKDGNGVLKTFKSTNDGTDEVPHKHIDSIRGSGNVSISQQAVGTSNPANNICPSTATRRRVVISWVSGPDVYLIDTAAKTIADGEPLFAIAGAEKTFETRDDIFAIASAAAVVAVREEHGL